jgi:hypothetical protein
VRRWAGLGRWARPRRGFGRAAAALLLGGAVWAAAGAGPAPVGWLSWEPAPGALQHEELTGVRELPVYLGIDAPAAIDSLGFTLRWATADPAGRLALLGVQTAAGEPLDLTARAADSLGHDAGYDALGALLSDAGALARLVVPEPGGGVHYRLALQLRVAGARDLRLELAGLRARLAGGPVVQLGNPVIAAGDGWRLSPPPTITRIHGRLNALVLESRLGFDGYGLDRLTRLVLIDSTGTRIYPKAIVAQAPEHLEATFATKSPALGRVTVEFGGPDGLRDTLQLAVEVNHFAERLPGDTTLGAIPGKE